LKPDSLSCNFLPGLLLPPHKINDKNGVRLTNLAFSMTQAFFSDGVTEAIKILSHQFNLFFLFFSSDGIDSIKSLASLQAWKLSGMGPVEA